ncbi:MAG: TAT-variant-translocated molybdopterin oxidoreductase [Verrucomicrobia bacterium]|nr:TAT-variant-translocated molybdopterin oxidoreductase [Verrucomicrobiota bacterium]
MSEKAGKQPKLEDVQVALSYVKGREYWRSLDELSGEPGFEETIRNEFPGQVAEWDPINRRDFMRLMGAALSLGGLTACTKQPQELIVPYVKPPEEMVPGKPLFYATAMSLNGFGLGLLAESHMGRPTKLEGNPEHPSSLGGTDIFAQAEILTMYDPDRSRSVRGKGPATWADFEAAISSAREDWDKKEGEGLRILTGTVTSPTLSSQISRLLAKYPKAKWHQYDPINRDSAIRGSEIAFGECVSTVCHFDRAKVVLSLDSDFMNSGPGRVRYARDFASRRDVGRTRSEWNRFYAIEASPTVTGSVADHRLPCRAGEMEGVARAIAQEVGVDVPGVESPFAKEHQEWVSALVNDLKANRGSGIVICGDHLPPEVHAIVHAINQALGNVGTAITYIEPIEADPVLQNESLRSLMKDIESGAVKTLVILDANPVYSAPGDLDFKNALGKVSQSIHLGLHEDETGTSCDWHLPQAHFLEGWGDIRAHDGTVSIVQPLILPLFGGKTAIEVVSTILGEKKAGHDTVKKFWSDQGIGDWRKALHDGVVPKTEARTVSPTLKSLRKLAVATETSTGIEIVIRPDATVWDGRYSNNGWLQELPKPDTKLTWDSVAMMSPSTAGKLGLQSEDVVVIRAEKRPVAAPVWVAPGVAADTVVLTLGYGRTKAGQVGSHIGYNAAYLRGSDSPWTVLGAEIEKKGITYKLATTQKHHSMEGRGLAREGTVGEYEHHPHFAHDKSHDPYETDTLYPVYDYSKGEQWGMAINLNACIGCNACIVACQAENNIPIVGKEEVARGREMQWIRLDRYHKGDAENPEVSHQPVPCMHCENAPCETVCPVGATSHSHEGLNQMVYNRCIGTRYCSNNCPYKVRRFNFFKYTDDKTPSLKLQRNPDVTVRARGIMEKCSYCVQRINAARIEAKKENRPVRDGEVITACQQACPTQAIAFGNINDPKSEVAKAKSIPLNYGMLTMLNTRPRTTYLARLRNPNPALADDGGHA